MIIVLNGYPGVGKLTIGRELAAILCGKLLDIHSVYNVAFALTEFRSPAFRDTVEKVEAIAHDLIQGLPPEVPVVFTTVLAGQDEWGDAEWARLEALGKSRAPFCVVHIGCSLEENKRRIQSEGRQGGRKPTDVKMAERNQSQAKPLHGLNAEHLLRIDTSDLSPVEAAQKIAEWCNERD